MDEYISFRSFITPIVINVVFWIGAALCVLAGLIMIVHAGSDPDGVAVAVLGGLLTMVLGPILVRIYCELIMLGFKIYDTVVDIRDNTAPAQPPAP